MLYGFLLTLYLINCFLLVLIILLQKGKGGLGLGGLGGGAQMIFGGGGGQDSGLSFQLAASTVYLPNPPASTEAWRLDGQQPVLAKAVPEKCRHR